ncbi:hypothetical protein TWF730_002556 [Orbilia blumenaviensis]|uniref:Chromo domain-containing protein n=1 Tax=Orbilia blumenaviensis TaxID=1796055 RepID=A0AAV9UEF1_9PEZI
MSYELCLESCPVDPVRCPTKIKLPVTHPFFDDTVFPSPVCGESNRRRRDSATEKGSKQDSGRDVSVLHLLHLPRVVWQTHPDASLTNIRVSSSTTVRQLISKTWEPIRQLYLSKPHPYAETMEYVRISFKPNDCDEIAAEEEEEEEQKLILRLEVVAGEGYWEQVDRELVWRGRTPEPRFREWKSPDSNLYRRIGNHVERLFTSNGRHGSYCKGEHAAIRGNI